MGAKPLETSTKSDATVNSANSSYPKYMIKEEALPHHASQSLQTPGKKTTRSRTKEPQQMINAQKYEQLMAQTFIPELSILEKRISELSKMPD